MTSSPPAPEEKGLSQGQCRPWLWAILAASWAVRLALVLRGGQLYFSDEGRYAGSRAAARYLAQGHLQWAIGTAFGQADHLFFKVLGVIPALLELPFGGDCPQIPAAFFSLFSVVAIGLVWRLAQALGAKPLEALLATAALAGCSSYVYYARHLFPYDPGMVFALLGFLFALRPAGLSQYLGGVFAGLAFVTYNGYWQTAGAFLVSAAWVHRRSLPGLVGYGIRGVLGLATPIIAVLLIGRSVHIDLVTSYVEFSGTTTTGDFGTLWRVAVGYYWTTERGLAVVWLACLLWAMVGLLRGSTDRRMGYLLGVLGVLLLALFGPPDLAHRFLTLARHTRAIPVLMSLFVGWGLAQVIQFGRPGRIAVGVVLAGLVVNLAAGLWLPFKLVFPAQFEKQADAFIAQAAARDGGRYRVINATFFNNPSEVVETVEHTKVVLSVRHPLEFHPYLYDAWSNAYRAQFMAMPLRMRVLELLPEDPRGRLQLPQTSGRWRPYPGALHLELYIDALAPGTGYPLVTTGKPGDGESAYVLRTDARHLALGYDSWGLNSYRSPPVVVDPAKPHSIDITFGALYPAERAAVRDPALASLRHRVRLRLDGVEVLNRMEDSREPDLSTFRYLRNPIGMSTSAPEFPGRVLTVNSIDEGY